MENNRSGFTLLELTVALGLFSIIVSIALGGFSSAMRTQRQAVALISANNNIGLVLEQMAREIRNGSSFSCNDQICPSADQLGFYSGQADQSVSYSRQVLPDGRGVIQRSIVGSSQDLTSDNVDVTYLKFIIKGADPTTYSQPQVTILLGLRPVGDASVSNTEVNIQTTVSSRQNKVVFTP